MEKLRNLVIRPDRREYEVADLGLKRFQNTSEVSVVRTDFVVRNARGLVLQCSRWDPVLSDQDKPLLRTHCVIYCHGNCGSRLDALDVVYELCLDMDITVVGFDFAGSGLSDGEHVSLGYYEQQDLEAVVKYMRPRSGLIGLWGRSMGAVTSLCYAKMDPSIAVMVLDSPFSELRRLLFEVVAQCELKVVRWLPQWVVELGVSWLEDSVQEHADFSIRPTLYGHASGDAFVVCEHSKILHEVHAGDSELLLFEGTHNSSRSMETMKAFCSFIHQTFSLNAYELSLELRMPSPSQVSTWDDCPSGCIRTPPPLLETIRRSPIQLDPLEEDTQICSPTDAKNELPVDSLLTPLQLELGRKWVKVEELINERSVHAI